LVIVKMTKLTERIAHYVAGEVGLLAIYVLPIVVGARDWLIEFDGAIMFMAVPAFQIVVTEHAPAAL